jgi:hypothetical protein
MKNKMLIAAVALCWTGVAYADGNDKTISANLDGASVLSGGDSDGSGIFNAVISEDSNQLCYSLSAANIGPAGVAHIHEGVAGMPGRPVIELTVASNGCVNVSHSLLEDIKNNPSDYYVDVVHASNGTDAIRGQLAG